MEDAISICPVCHKKYPKSGKMLYCSTECKKIAVRVLRKSWHGYYVRKRKVQWLSLIEYVEKNNLKKPLKKYFPKMQKNKKNENA